MSSRWFRILSALAAIVGVVMLIASFNVNPGPPPDATAEQIIAFGREYYALILWGAWLQTVGPLLIVTFAFALVIVAGATNRLAGWMTLFGGTILMVVSLVEVTFYLSATFSTAVASAEISLALIHAVQHLYFVVAAPALFLPLGLVILGTSVIARAFGYLAIALGAAFAVIGVATLMTPVLPGTVQAFAGVQAVWWLAAAIDLLVRPPPAASNEADSRAAMAIEG